MSWSVASACALVVAGLAVAGTAALLGQWPLAAVVAALVACVAAWPAVRWSRARRTRGIEDAVDPDRGGPAVLGSPPPR